MSAPDGSHLSFPFHVGPDGRAAQVDSLSGHVRDELIQLILTNPGERAFLPEFGGGARRLVFENVDPTTRGVTKAMLTQAISRWLGDRITLDDLTVGGEDETVEVEIKYRIADTDDTRIMRFQRGGG